MLGAVVDYLKMKSAVVDSRHYLPFLCRRVPDVTYGQSTKCLLDVWCLIKRLHEFWSLSRRPLQFESSEDPYRQWSDVTL